MIKTDKNSADEMETVEMGLETVRR